MTNFIHNLNNVKEIVTKLSLVLFQPTRVESSKRRPAEWVYRGEGNANLVISLPGKRQILRIRKTRRSNNALFDWLMGLVAEYLDNGACDAEESLDVRFYRYVMAPLLGSFVCDVLPVEITRRQTEELNRALMQCRPNYRKHKKLKFGKATFLTDFAFLPKHLDSYQLIGSTYAVEIKPKQGWIPIASRRKKCKFCLNQYLKLANGQIKKITSYCPLDLFSGDKSRTIKAIKSLINNPQNNFKIFRNGVQVYGDQNSREHLTDLLRDWLYEGRNLSEERLFDDFTELIYATLMKPFDKKLYPTLSVIPSERYGNSNLPEGCILERILSVQKLDVCGVDHYKALKERLRIGNGTDYVKALLAVVDDHGSPFPSTSRLTKQCDSIFKTLTESRETESELDLAPYLIASVANDCSFMLTYKKMMEKRSASLDQRYILDSPCGSYAINMGIFDLYPKPTSTIDKHFKRNQETAKLLSEPPESQCLVSYF